MLIVTQGVNEEMQNSFLQQITQDAITLKTTFTFVGMEKDVPFKSMDPYKTSMYKYLTWGFGFDTSNEKLMSLAVSTAKRMARIQKEWQEKIDPNYKPMHIWENADWEQFGNLKHQVKDVA
jgi:lipid II:glycine glycyltransferase (peptidoglycan interpeptide bridge formation enzyme)